MAEKYDFVQGVFSNEFLQLKTDDDVYLKDLLEQQVFPALSIYNADVEVLSRLLAYKHEDKAANVKRLFADNSFAEISEHEVPPMGPDMESWNTPQPLHRFGSGNKMTMEVIVQMTSKQIIEYQNSVFRADKAKIRRQFFESMLKSTPDSTVDCLTAKAATPKAFWNDEASQDTPRSNGQITFDGDHNHYTAVSTGDAPTAAEVTALITTILEHEGMGDAQIILWARQGGESMSDLRDLSGFRQIEGYAALIGAVNPAYEQSGIAQALINAKKHFGRTAQAVGTFKEAIVMQTPDIPDDYILATAYLGDNSPFAPIGWREHPQFKGLIMASPTNENPIIGHNAQYRRYLSGHVNNRDAGAVLYTGDTTYADPTFV